MRIVQRYDPEKKQLALSLRKRGYTYTEIQEKLLPLRLPKNTLSDWCQKSRIVLTEQQRRRIVLNQREKLQYSQRRGGIWNRQQKVKRLNDARFDASHYLSNNPRTNVTDLYFFLGLYLGEGSKDDHRVLFANANPQVVRAYVRLLRKLFPIREEKLRVSVHIRFDQIDENLKRYWSSLTEIPLSQFHKTTTDNRTKNQQTYQQYKGVCAIYYSDAKIQRFLLELQRQYLSNILESGG